MNGREQDRATRVPILDRWIQHVFETAPKLCDGLSAHRPKATVADRLFMQIIG